MPDLTFCEMSFLNSSRKASNMTEPCGSKTPVHKSFQEYLHESGYFRPPKEVEQRTTRTFTPTYGNEDQSSRTNADYNHHNGTSKERVTEEDLHKQCLNISATLKSPGHERQRIEGASVDDVNEGLIKNVNDVGSITMGPRPDDQKRVSGSVQVGANANSPAMQSKNVEPSEALPSKDPETGAEDDEVQSQLRKPEDIPIPRHPSESSVTSSSGHTNQHGDAKMVRLSSVFPELIDTNNCIQSVTGFAIECTT